MAHVSDGNSESPVVELNLVPFIDLMSVCIIFLLITAVWIQISMIQLGTSVYAKKVDENDPPPAQTPHAEVPFRIDVVSKGYKMILGSQVILVPLAKRGRYDHEGLTKQLQAVKKVYPDKMDVVVTSEDKLLYKHLIMAMDLLLQAGFPQVSIAPGEVI